jgi:glyoxylase-like metal-dependent hydrolase (beta-lactamase superfamily II)
VSSVEKVREGLHIIDLDFQGEPGVIAAYLLESAGEYALVEVGPTTTLEALLAGIRTVGVEPAAISKLIVTHIHLDHAGAAGSLIRRFPSMRLYVHEIGAPHTIDPSKLLASAERIYGDQMGPLWGEVVPVPSESITTLRDGDTIAVGAARLAVLYTPGHASHHVVFHDLDHNDVFTGDVTAVRLQGYDHVRPATPPPDVDLDLWTGSLERLRSLQPAAVYLTHYGAFRDVETHLHRARSQLYAWADFVEGLQKQDLPRDEMKAQMKERADAEVRADHDDPEAIRRYEFAAPAGMSVDGYLRYFRKRAAAAEAVR